jgi:hypothetical protein
MTLTPLVDVEELKRQLRREVMKTLLHRIQQLLLRCMDQLRDHEHNKYVVRLIRSYVHLLVILKIDGYLMI